MRFGRLSAAFAALFMLTQCESFPLKNSPDDGLSQVGLGMATGQEKESGGGKAPRPKAKSRNRRHRERSESESEDDQLQMVTIDLSALRPSLPGLVLYKYGEQAPKLVQVDLDALNPQLQPHVIWPQFTRQGGDLSDSYYDFFRDNLEDNQDIPYLGEDESLIPLHTHQMAKLSSESSEDWPNLNDLADGDIYDFLPGSFRNEEMMTLHNSLPLADEVIVPLDWEEGETAKKNSDKKEKKNVFISRGWKAGGEPHPRSSERSPSSGTRDYSRGAELPERVRFISPFGSNGWRPGKRQQGTGNPNIEKEEDTYEAGKTGYKPPHPPSDVLSKTYSNPYQPTITEQGKGQGVEKPLIRISSQESWNQWRPRNQWSDSKHFGTRW